MGVEKYFKKMADFYISVKDAQTAEEAWEKTIEEKWKLLLDGEKIRGAGYISCGLCNVFMDNKDMSPECPCCPIVQVLGDAYEFCENTPFQFWLTDKEDKNIIQFEINFLEAVRDGNKEEALRIRWEAYEYIVRKAGW